MAYISLEHVSKLFPQPRGQNIAAVQDLTLTVERGEFLVIVGPSGCGKTTTLRLLSGLEEPSGGSILIDGHLMDGVAPKDRNVAMVLQNPALFPHMTAGENITFGLRIRKCPRAEVEQRLRQAAELLGINECLDRRPAELSGGQCQRVALGRALVRRPDIFLFDEPLSNLDPQMRSQLRHEIRRLHRRLGTTSIYVTHDQLEAMNLGDHIAVMNQGTIHQIGSPSEIYRHPVDLFVARFVGFPEMNFFSGRLLDQDGCLWFAEKKGAAEVPPLKAKCPPEYKERLRNHIGKDLLLGIRPGDLLCQANGDAREGSDIVAAVAEFVEGIGPEVYVHLRRGELTLTSRAQAADNLSPGQTVSVGMNLEQAHFFDAGTGKNLACES